MQFRNNCPGRQNEYDGFKFDHMAKFFFFVISMAVYVPSSIEGCQGEYVLNNS